MQGLINSGSTSTLLLLAGCARQPSSCSLQLNFVRYKKPRWLPPSKKRQFYVTSKKFPPPLEKEERQDLNNKWGTHIKSIW